MDILPRIPSWRGLGSASIDYVVHSLVDPKVRRGTVDTLETLHPGTSGFLTIHRRFPLVRLSGCQVVSYFETHTTCPSFQVNLKFVRLGTGAPIQMTIPTSIKTLSNNQRMMSGLERQWMVFRERGNI